MLAARGETVIGVDSGSPDGRGGLRGSGVEVSLDADGVEELERARCVVKSPGVPAEAPVIAAARERGLPVIGELELSWRLLPNRFCAVTGTNGKTTVAELLGHIWRTAGEPVAVAGNVGTPLASLVGEVDARGDDRDLRGVELPARGLRGLRARVRGAAQPRPRPPRPPPTASSATATRSCGCSPTRPRATSPSSTAPTRVWPGSRSPAGGAQGRLRRSGSASSSSRCPAATTPPTPRPPPSPRRRWGSTTTRSPRRWRASPGSRTGSSGSPRSTACSTSTTRRRPTSPPRRRRCGRSTAASARSSAARPRARASPTLAEPVAERCVACYLIGEAAEQLERDLEPAWEAGVAHRRCGGLAEAVRGRGRRRRAGRGRPARAGLRQLRRLPRLRAARRALPRALVGSAFDEQGRTKALARRIEYSLLLTATLCLLAFGVVMVFSASSTTSLLGESGDSAYYLKRTLIFGALGLGVMHLLAGRGVKIAAAADAADPRRLDLPLPAGDGPRGSGSRSTARAPGSPRGRCRSSPPSC